MENLQAAIMAISELTRQGDNREHLTENVASTFDGAEVAYDYIIEPTQFGPKLGAVVKPLRAPKLEVSTLTGFLDAIAAGVAGEPNTLSSRRIVHVVDYLTVALKTTVPDNFGVRDTLLEAKFVPAGTFKFDEFQTAEKFLIDLRTQFLFVEGDDSLLVQAIASNLKAGRTVHSQDDGVNQTVTLQLGQVETIEKNIPKTVKLTPIRTFAEAPPVQADFMLRLKPQGDTQLPLIALYNLGGSKWQGEAMLAIKSFLSGKVPDSVPIIA